ncbi:serine hydrolase [Xenorhabdus sp. XENO-7]|uniref:Serine hydrolase n=1 Tax=Xenorhabdus aichiensis TaxID=3025874 RepID=A0ABT5M4Q1_9GAMM|nr:serine hydrolase domain-containing protein [Xenorhabdus aichiensis]MDC9622664.1 serine hydrolase [Xenorhabdus aichiensis]
MAVMNTVALQRALDNWLLFSPCLGVNVTLSDSLGNHWHSASGFEQFENKTEMKALQQCYIYSITKTFTAIRILQLVEQEKLALDSRLTEILGHCGLDPTITIRQLLNHTAGVPNYTEFDGYDAATKASPGTPWSYDYTLALSGEKGMKFSPGEGWDYSNTGYMLLAKVIEVVTGESFQKNINDGIILPLELTKTYVASDIDRGTVIPGFSRWLNHNDVMENITGIYHPHWCKTELMVSTTKEICQVYQALFQGKILSPALLAEMCKPISIGRSAGPFYRKPSYGMGLMIDSEWGHGGLFGHGGEGPGFNTWALYLPEYQERALAICIFCNTSMAGQPIYLVKDLLRVLGASFTE